MKQLPHSKELERATLGAILIDKNALRSALEIIPDSDFFYDLKHQVVYDAILQLFAANDDIDVLTVVDQINRMGKIEQAGGPAGVFELTLKVNSSMHIETHCRKLQEAYIKRKIIDASTKMLEKAFDPMSDALEILTQNQTETIALSDLVNRKQEKSLLQILTSCINDIHQKRQNSAEVTGIPSACSTINKITAGWQPSDLIILAARPGAGKTAFALHEILHAAKYHNVPAGVFSIEMAANQLVNRFICAETVINSNSIRRPVRLSENDLVKINKDTAKLATCPIYIDDTAGITILQLRSKAAKWKAKYNIQFLVIDYIQLIRNPSVRNREQEIASITRQLKELAKELHLPVIALSQLSRAVEQRPDKRPLLSDLRESGAIEQDADVVAFLYREEYYNPNCDPEEKNKTEVIFAKHRNGSLDTVILDSDLATNRYDDAGKLYWPVNIIPMYPPNNLPESTFEELEEMPF